MTGSGEQQGSRIPKFIEDAAFSGAGEGTRNDRAFWLAAQCRDARLSPGDAASLMDIFARRCSPPLPEREAKAALASAFRSTPREPPVSKRSSSGGRQHVKPGSGLPDEVIPFDGEIGPRAGGDEPDWSADVPAPSGDPAGDLRGWLAALFAPEDKVNYVVRSFLDEDGKWKPRGLGVTRTRADIEADLAKYERKGHKGEALLRYVLGDWEPGGGVWARINPMDGTGSTNANVVRLDHVLVEGDEQEIGKQIAVIRSLRLPCRAVVHSGGKSVHAVVRVEAGTDKAAYAERTAALFKALQDAGFTPDVKCKNSSRLSRMPGPSRAGKPQYLVSGPCGAESWDAWLAEREESEFRAEMLDIDAILAHSPEEDDSLVGDRFLCRSGSWLISAQSGIGKSVLAIQGAVSFSIGRDLFGLKVKGPKRNLMIQAENNKGDMRETMTGVTSGMMLGEGEILALKQNMRTVHCSRYSGERFVRFLAHLCRAWRPDIVWIDPLLAYMGGEITKSSDCAKFFRNTLNPVVEDFDIGVVIIHHMPKPPKRTDDAKYKGYDLSYAGIGASDITNWARATSTVTRMDGCDNRFCFEHSKRGERAGCRQRVELMHGAGSDICWYAAPGVVRPEAGARGGRPKGGARKYDGFGFEQMPPLAGPSREDKYDPAKSPAVLWVMDKLEASGTPLKPPAAFNVMNKVLRDDYIEFDSSSRMWKGRFYDPDFK